MVHKETDPGDIVDADGTGEMDEFPVIKQGDLSVHFMYGLFDGHTIRFRYEKEVKVVPIYW